MPEGAIAPPLLAGLAAEYPAIGGSKCLAYHKDSCVLGCQRQLFFRCDMCLERHFALFIGTS